MGAQPDVRGWHASLAGSGRPEPASPRLVLHLDTVRDRFRALRRELAGVELCYAVKANPHPAVLELLVAEGASFDLASVGELDACLFAGATPRRLSWGNPVKKATDVRAALTAGVDRFTTDAAADVDLLAREAPGARVGVRLAVDDAGAATPFGGKFGVDVGGAVALLRRARESGLRATGVGFHVGSQQLDVDAWGRGAEQAAQVAAELGADAPVELNLGGGFPTRHAHAWPTTGPDEGPGTHDGTPATHEPSPTEALARIRRVLEGTAWSPRLVAEPGRVVVAEAGVLRAEVVLVTRRAGRRWVYLDVGRYSGLAETEQEMIVYRLRTPGRDGPDGPVVLAGPTCDGDDVLYRHAEVRLPLDLAPGDVVELLGAGAYTASYASVGFNGLPPLPTLIDDSRAPTEGDR